MAELRVELLGGFRVRAGNREVPGAYWRRRKPAAVLKMLALAPGHRLRREQIMDALWPQLTPEAAAANLRKAVHQARRALQTVDRDDAIASEGDLVALPRDGLRLDVDDFRAAVAAGRRDSDVEAYERAVALYRDGVLPEDVYEDWSVGPRTELHSELLAVLHELAGHLEARGDLEQAVDVLRRLVAEDPLLEEAHVSLMRLHALAGRRAEAERTYEHLGRLLAAELGAEPAAETQMLYEEIRTRQAFEPELTCDLWERVGDLRTLSGDVAGAARAFEAALGSSTDRDVTARLERKCAEAWLVQHRPDEAAAHLDAAQRLLRDDPADPAERARVVRVRAHHAWETGDFSSAQRDAERARDAAHEHGTPEDVAAAYEALAIVSHYRGEWRQGLESEMHRLAADAAGPEQLGRVFDIHHCIGQYHLYGDGLSDSVEDYARRLLDRAEKSAAVRAEAFAWCLLGESLLLQARWDESMACLERSCELHASLGSRTGALAWQRRAELAVCREAFADAERYLRRAAAIATVSAMATHLWGRIQATRAFAAVEQGDAARAVHAVRAAAEAAARYGDCPTCSALLNPMAAEAYALLGQPEAAREHAESASRVAQMFASSAWRAMAESAAGSHAVAVGDEQAAAEHFEGAGALYEQAGQPFWAYRSGRLAAAGSA